MDRNLYRRMDSANSRLGAWSAWRERCSLALCGGSDRTKLLDYAGYHGNRYLRRYAHRAGDGQRLDPLPAEEIFHLLEVHFTVQQTRRGKCYKSWLFARASGSASETANAVEGGAALLIRDVIRDYIRRECPCRRSVAMDQVVRRDHREVITLGDLLPAPRTEPEPAQHELNRQAERCADRFLPTMTDRETIILRARLRKIPLSHPDVLRTAGVGKSRVHEIYRHMFTRLADCVRELTPEEMPAFQRRIALAAYDHIAERMEPVRTQPDCTFAETVT